MDKRTFGIFKMTVVTTEGATISFTALMNPAETKKVLVLEADSIEDAATEASKMLKVFGVKTTTLRGDPDTVMHDFPNYFVGEIRNRTADLYDTSSLAFHINNFEPVK